MEFIPFSLLYSDRSAGARKDSDSITALRIVPGLFYGPHLHLAAAASCFGICLRQRRQNLNDDIRPPVIDYLCHLTVKYKQWL